MKYYKIEYYNGRENVACRLRVEGGILAAIALFKRSMSWDIRTVQNISQIEYDFSSLLTLTPEPLMWSVFYRPVVGGDMQVCTVSAPSISKVQYAFDKWCKQNLHPCLYYFIVGAELVNL